MGCANPEPYKHECADWPVCWLPRNQIGSGTSLRGLDILRPLSSEWLDWLQRLCANIKFYLAINYNPLFFIFFNSIFRGKWSSKIKPYKKSYFYASIAILIDLISKENIQLHVHATFLNTMFFLYKYILPKCLYSSHGQ